MITRTRGSKSGATVTCPIHGTAMNEILVRQATACDLPLTVYYHHDGLGSTVALTDSTGNVVESYTYDVYGQPSFLSATYQLLPTSAVTNRFLFTGREYLAELALYDYRHRFYSPFLGRFLQTDPLRFDAEDVNLYRYVRNTPLNSTDPNGLFIGWFQKWYHTIKNAYRRECPKQLGTYELTDEKIIEEARRLYEELKSGHPRREDLFDSNFYTGFTSEKHWKYKGRVYSGNEVNYLGIGMYEASLGRSPDVIIRHWKGIWYFESPSEEVFYWAEKGRIIYQMLEGERLQHHFERG